MIRELRRKRGLTQSKLAEMAGIRQGVLSYIENGRTKHPRIDTMTAIAKALGVTLEELTKKKAG